MQAGPAAIEAWVQTLAQRFGPGAGPVSITQTSSGAVIARCGEVVVKLHRPGTDPVSLAVRLRLAGDPRLASVLVAPSTMDVVPVPDGVDRQRRSASVWPRCEVLDPAESASHRLPWADAGALLAALHRVPAPTGTPRDGGGARLGRALRRLDSLTGAHLAGAVAAVRAAGLAAAADGAAAEDAATTLVHGDWHLGQLARLPGRSRWLLLDLDDLGTGCPAVDLGRPAGFWAAGLLDDAAWSAFLAAYRAGGGPGVPPAGDPWPALDRHARAAVVVAAARALVDALVDGRGELDREGTALIEACHRMRTADP